MTAGDTGKHVAQPGFGIDAVKLGGLYQRVDRGGTLAALVRAGEGPVAATEGNATQTVLSAVVVRLEATVIAVPGQRGAACNGIADRLREIISLYPTGGSHLAQPHPATLHLLSFLQHHQSSLFHLLYI